MTVRTCVYCGTHAHRLHYEEQTGRRFCVNVVACLRRRNDRERIAAVPRTEPVADLLWNSEYKE